MGNLGRGSKRQAWRAIVGTALLLGVAGAGLMVSGAVAPASATPWPGPEPTPTNLVFFLHNSSTNVTVGAVPYLQVMSTVNDAGAPWAGTGEISVGKHYNSVAFVAAPQLAAPIVLNGTVTASVYMNQTGSSLTGGSIILSIYDVSPSGALTLLGAGPGTGTSVITPGSVPLIAPLVGPTLSNVTVPAGDSIQVNITISGNTATYYGIWWGNVSATTYESQVIVPASKYLTVASVEVYNSTGAPTNVLSSFPADKTLTISAVVADPLGAYDFEAFPVDFTVTNSTGVTLYGPFAMAPDPSLAAPGAPNGTYTIAFNYSGLAPGIYNFTVNATDNTNHNIGGQNTLPSYFGRAASLVATVVVGLPPVPVSVQVTDDHAQLLGGAVVRAAVGSAVIATNVTNATTGIAGFTLPNGTTYNFTVYWQGVWAGNFTRSVDNASLVFHLTADVIYPTFEVESTTGYPLPYALISVVHPNGETLPLQVANDGGIFTLGQVPIGNYTFTVIYDDSEVLSFSVVPVTSDAAVIPLAVTGVYTLTVETATSGGSVLSGIFVTIVNNTTGATIASGITNDTGILAFLVPVGTYRVIGDWSTTYYLTPVRQTLTNLVTVDQPTATTLKFTKAFPAITSTNEFYLVLAFAALAAIIVLLAVLLVRSRRRKQAPPLTPAPPITPPESTQEPPSKTK